VSAASPSLIYVAFIVDPLINRGVNGALGGLLPEPLAARARHTGRRWVTPGARRGAGDRREPARAAKGPPNYSVAIFLSAVCVLALGCVLPVRVRRIEAVREPRGADVDR
jgi:hypothetical protein